MAFVWVTRDSSPEGQILWKMSDPLTQGEQLGMLGSEERPPVQGPQHEQSYHLGTWWPQQMPHGVRSPPHEPFQMSSPQNPQGNKRRNLTTICRLTHPLGAKLSDDRECDWVPGSELPL